MESVHKKHCHVNKMLYRVIGKKVTMFWYAFLGLCRPIKGICGMIREIIAGLVANLETRQQRREICPLDTQGLPPQMTLKR